MISTRSIRHLPSGTGRTFSVLGDSVTFKGEPDDDTPGAPLLFEHMLPATLGVPPHTERNHEAFYVLDGTLVVESEGERYRLGAGDFLSIPPGVPHALHNPGPGPARVLTLVSPGSQHVRFFSAVGRPIEDPNAPPAPDAPPDIPRLLAVGRECGIEFLPPQKT
ncbi:MAG TPA: cupin domain-containing protein [Gemmatimonadaceae bacterium]|nr:cupin domain-containing protein [Gemmatimonadaceae bacterium]